MVDTLVDYGAKYRKIAFASPGHAFNLAEWLNRQFRTTEFTVYLLAGGTVAVEDDD